MPAVENTCDAVSPLAEVPSPKLMTELVIVPSGSEDPAALTLIVAGAYAELGVAAITATGAWLMPVETTIGADLLAVAPRLSVTVPVIVYVPAVLYV